MNWNELMFRRCERTMEILLNGTPVGEEREFLDTDAEKELYDALIKVMAECKARNVVEVK